MTILLTDEMKISMQISYALRHIPEAHFACLLLCSDCPQLGDIVPARLEKIGKTDIPCLTAQQLQCGDVIAQLLKLTSLLHSVVPSNIEEQSVEQII